jgi:PP-loop superfamily ATP-utilizing enzyme
VRHTPSSLCNFTEIRSFFKDLGFKYVVASLEGYRQGSLNEVLPEVQTAPASPVKVT